MNVMLVGQYISSNSLIHRLGALTKLICFLLILFGIIGTKTLLGYGLLAFLAVIAYRLSKLPAKAVLSPIGRIRNFFIVIFLMNALFFSGDNLFLKWGIFSLSRGGIIQGVNIVARVVLVMVFSGLLMLSTPPMEITNALKQIMRPLGWFGIPVGQIAMILSIAIQFVPVLFQSTETIRMAQIARGARFESKKLWEKAFSYLPLIIPVFLLAFQKADELAMAMEARGFRNDVKRSIVHSQPLHYFDFAAVVSSLAICLILVILC